MSIPYSRDLFETNIYFSGNAGTDKPEESISA